MNPWLKNAIKNLLPLSIEKKDFNKALKEWSFTGETIDYEQAEELCELCEMEGLRYHFQISNSLNNSLLVGSKCIERFDIKVVNKEGEEISGQDKEAYLMRQLRERHINGLIASLAASETKQYLGEHSKSSLDLYSINCVKYNTVNARVLNYLFLRFHEENFHYNKSLFSIDIRSQANKDKLLSLNQVQLERIKPALSNSQIAYYIKHKRRNDL